MILWLSRLQYSTLMCPKFLLILEVLLMFFFVVVEWIGIGVVDLQSVVTHLFGFSWHVVQSLRQIKLLVSLEEESKWWTILTTFTVVEAPSSYNIILGCPTLSEFQAMAYPFHQKIKFPIEVEVGKVQWNQQVSWKCYVMMVHIDHKRSHLGTMVGERKKLVEEVQKEDSTFLTQEELEVVVVELDNQEKTIRISRELSLELKRELVDYLVWNRDIFSWSMVDLAGISLEDMAYTSYLWPIRSNKKVTLWSRKE